ncbi:MAG: hypothetical protein J3Q66DRAFT_445190 [Benniella sp.]|nr:MAG: hypothetical protein J3Q66DRAFT_445190 [Benniella sp.]
MEYFVHTFKDPPNVQELLKSVRPPLASVEASRRIHQSQSTKVLQIDFKPSNLQMGEVSTRKKAFVAALYLRDRLCLEEKELPTWCTGPPSKRLNAAAREILAAEPMLQGIGVEELVMHYQRVIKLYRDLEVGLQAGAYPHWKPTHFSNIARGLCIIENNTGLARLRMQRQEAKRRRKAEKKEKWMILQQSTQARNDETLASDRTNRLHTTASLHQPSVPMVGLKEELQGVLGIVTTLQATVISQAQEIMLLKQQLFLEEQQCAASAWQVWAQMDPHWPRV